LVACRRHDTGLQKKGGVTVGDEEVRVSLSLLDGGVDFHAKSSAAIQLVQQQLPKRCLPLVVVRKSATQLGLFGAGVSVEPRVQDRSDLGEVRASDAGEEGEHGLARLQWPWISARSVVEERQRRRDRLPLGAEVSG
jgi:hypothetical protein